MNNKILELENENRTCLREELSLEKLKDNSVLVTVVVDENTGYGYRDDSLLNISSYTLSKEQIVEVIDFLTKSLNN